MPDRELDWKDYINALVYCYGCGRFGKPSSKGIPTGWKVLYNPHSEGKPGLHVCSDGCQAKVLAALKEGPVLEPLEMGAPPPMPQEMREAAIDGSIRHRVRERVATVLEDDETIEAVTEAVSSALIEKNNEVKEEKPFKPFQHCPPANVIPLWPKGQSDCPSEEEDDERRREDKSGSNSAPDTEE